MPILEMNSYAETSSRLQVASVQINVYVLNRSAYRQLTLIVEYTEPEFWVQRL